MLNERRAGRSDRTADFRELAVWFAEAPDEAAMHQLWQASFGLHSARHLTLDADTEQACAERPVPTSTPWAEAPPLEISPRLRRTGSYERRGKPNRVIDRTAGRQLLAQRAAGEAQPDRRRSSAASSPSGLCASASRGLDPDAFALFLALLGEALGARRPGQRETRTTTGDGSLRSGSPRSRCRRWRSAPQAGAFRGPDHVLEILDLATRAEARGVNPTLDATLAEAHDRDRARAARALLRRPLLRHGADPGFRLVRRHATELRSGSTTTPAGGCTSTPGRPAVQARRGTRRDTPGARPARPARLRPPPLRAAVPGAVRTRARGRADHARPPRGTGTSSRPATSGRRGRRQLRAQRPRGAQRSRRRRAAAARIGVLGRVAGDEEAFVREAGDVLYDVQRRVLAVLLARRAARRRRRAIAFDTGLHALAAEPEPAFGRAPHPGDPPPPHPPAARRARASTSMS